MNAHARCLDWLAATRAGARQIGIFTSFTDPLAAETLAQAGYDWVLVDLQHGAADLAHLPVLMQAIEGAGAAPLVRVTSSSAAEIGRALDCGAWAVVVPMVESAEQAAEAVAATRYPPFGVRSFGPFRGRAALDHAPRCFAMVETAGGLEAVDAICGVEGLLGVFVGPWDLAIGLGLSPDYALGSGQHHDAVGAIAAAARHAGVVPAIHTSGAAEARLRLEQGYSVVSMFSDQLVLRDAATAMRAELG